jgi:3-phenylpropionate/trans-cinnamate dioxygenase ferredoxin subunit
MTGTWRAIAGADELADGQMKPITAEGRRLLLVNAGGEHFLIDELCSHEDYSLALGCIRDGRIKCSLHGSWFDLRTGAALDEPADSPIGTYPVRIENGTVLARLGKP